MSPAEREDREDLGDRMAAKVEPQHAQATKLPWYQKDYPSDAKGAPKIRFPGTLYPPDVGDKTSRKQQAYTRAVKRAISRAGRWPWSGNFDGVYSIGFARGRKGGHVGESGVAGFQRQNQLEPDGICGKQTFEQMRISKVAPGQPNAGEFLFDRVCLSLLEEATARPKPSASDVVRIRAVIADYIQAAIRAEPYWSYSQARPMSNLGRKPGDRQTADCSTFATTALYWARLQTGIAVPDPNGYGYNGYGFTGSLMSFNSARRVFNSSFEIGDLALYGPNSSPWSTTHVCICYRAGSGYTSLWGSHGSQSGPGSRTLHYRSDLIGVYRPELLPK